MKKKVLSLLLATLMLVTIVPVYVFAEDDVLSYHLTYEINDGKATITGCDVPEDGTLVIPATIDGYDVNAIGEYAFCDCFSLEEVIIPDSVETIENSAFSDCTSLESIYLPDSVETIGNYAFSGCTSLESIILSDSLETIGNSAFYGCTSLKNVEFSEGITELNKYVFSSCSSLKSVKIPVSVQVIKDGCFNGCNNLSSIYYGGSESEWENIIVRIWNSNLIEADIYCNGIKIDRHIDLNNDGYCDNNDCNKYLWSDIYVGETRNVRIINGQGVFFIFTPETTGEYRLYGENYMIPGYVRESDDGCAWIYDSDMNQIAFGSGGPEIPLNVVFSLTAGETYYIKCHAVGHYEWDVYDGSCSYRVILEALTSDESTAEKPSDSENITNIEETTNTPSFGDDPNNGNESNDNGLNESGSGFINSLLNFFKNFIESLKKILTSAFGCFR